MNFDSSKISGRVESTIAQLQKLFDAAKTMSYTSEMMRNLMMDLLDFAQLEKNTFKLNKAYFSIFEVIDQAFAVVGHIAAKKNIRLVPPELDPQLHPYFSRIYGDKHRFIQVLINFLSNSLKFSL